MFKNLINYLNPTKSLVTRVKDGDTIEVACGIMNSMRASLRLARCNCPEIRNERYGKMNDEPFAQEAKAFTKDLVEGKYITWTKDVEGNTESYDRIVAWVFTPEGNNLSYLLVKFGLAKVWRNGQYYEQQKDLDSLEYDAKKRRLKVWDIVKNPIV
jgi:micrococcal nuclease